MQATNTPRPKKLWKAVLGAALAIVLSTTIISPAQADTTAGEGGGGGSQSGSSSWRWAYGDRPGDAWNAFVADWGSGVRVSGNSLLSNRGENLGVNLAICQNSAQIWWIHFDKTGYSKFWGSDPAYLVGGRVPSSWVGELGVSGSAREARGFVPAGTTLGNGYTTTSGAYFTDLVKGQASSWVASNTSNTSRVVLVCSELSPAKVVVEEGTQSKTLTNGDTHNAPASFTTVVQRQVLNTIDAYSTDNGTDLIGANNLHDQAASPVITNYGQIVAGVTSGTMFGGTSMNNLSRDQWNETNSRIATAKTQDASLIHGTVSLDANNRAGLAEGGVLNISEWAQRATITTAGSQTYTDTWRYTGVQYWNGSDWGAVQNLQWTDTRLTTTPTWNNAAGWNLDSEHYSVTSSTPTQENTGFWQLLSVHCNVDQLNALKTALIGAGRAATTIEQTNHDDGTVTAILRSKVNNQGWVDVPVANVPQQAAVNNAQGVLTAAETAHTNALKSYTAAVAARDTAQTTYNNAQAAFNIRSGNLTSVVDALEDANDAVTQAKDTYDTARGYALLGSKNLRGYVADLPAGLSSQQVTALNTALLAYESYYATDYVAVPSSRSTTAVTRVNAVRDTSTDSIVTASARDFLNKNVDLESAWNLYADAVAAQAPAQAAFNAGETQLVSYRTAMNNTANALEIANDSVDAASSLLATRFLAVTTAQEALDSANAVLSSSNGVTTRAWSPARPARLDFGDALNPASSLAASAYVGFYDKECVTDCTTSPSSPQATATNGAKTNVSNTSDLGNKDSLGGAVLTDAQVREGGSTSPTTNSNYLEIFRDNSTSRTVRVNTAFPVVTGTNFKYNGSAPFTTTVNLWGLSTPDTNPASGQFFMNAVNITDRSGSGTTEKLFDGMNGTNVWTTDLTRAPGTQKNFGNDLYSTGMSETFSGFANTFQIGATWASEKDRPVVLNVKWEYRPTTVVTVPTMIGFGSVLPGTDSASQFRIAKTDDVDQALDVRCYAQYGVTDSLDNSLSKLTQQYTGTGTTNTIDAGLITPANGDESYLENNNLVIKFVRGVAE